MSADDDGNSILFILILLCIFHFPVGLKPRLLSIALHIDIVDKVVVKLWADHGRWLCYYWLVVAMLTRVLTRDGPLHSIPTGG